MRPRLQSNGDRCCRGRGMAGGLLLAVAAPKLCCMAPVMLASLPALMRSLELAGAGATLAALDTLCSRDAFAGGSGPLDLPLTAAFGAAGLGAVLVWRAVREASLRRSSHHVSTAALP